MENFPIRKEYELPIIFEEKFLFFHRYKTINLRYKQATILEYIEFIQETKKNEINYFKWFLEKHWVDKKYLKNLKNIYQELWRKIEQSYLKWYINKSKIKTETRKIKESEQIPFNATLIHLSKELKIDPLEIMKKYTLEQLNYLSEWILYIYDNNKAKTSRKTNRKKQIENLPETEKQKLKDFINSD